MLYRIDEICNLVLLGVMYRPMKTGYSKLTVKSEALKYAIMDGDKLELPLRNANKD